MLLTAILYSFDTQKIPIEVPDHGLIGLADLVDIDWKNNHAFHGSMVRSREVRGQSYGSDTIMALMRYAFEELHL